MTIARLDEQRAAGCEGSRARATSSRGTAGSFARRPASPATPPATTPWSSGCGRHPRSPTRRSSGCASTCGRCRGRAASRQRCPRESCDRRVRQPSAEPGSTASSRLRTPFAARSISAAIAPRREILERIRRARACRRCRRQSRDGGARADRGSRPRTRRNDETARAGGSAWREQADQLVHAAATTANRPAQTGVRKSCVPRRVEVVNMEWAPTLSRTHQVVIAATNPSPTARATRQFWLFRAGIDRACSGGVHHHVRPLSAIVVATALAAGAWTMATNAQTSTVAIAVDAAAGQHPINAERLRRRARQHRGAERPERAAEPERRQQHHALQLAAERRQPRQRLVLREHRRQQRDRRRAGRYLRRERTRRERAGDADDPDDRLGREGRRQPRASSPASRSPNTARRPATTGSGSPTRATACAPTASASRATIRTTPTCRRTRSSSRRGCSIWSAAGARTRTAACATTSSTTSRASGTRPIATSTRRARRWTRSGTR